MNLTHEELATLNKMVISSVASGEVGVHDCIKEIHSKISEAIIKECEEREAMNFTYEELALLNKIIGISLKSGKIEFNEVSESVHKKVTDEIIKRNSLMEEVEQITLE